MEYILIFPSDLTDIIETDICKDPLPRRDTIIWLTSKTLEWSLDLDKVAGSYRNLLLVGSDQDSHPA